MMGTQVDPETVRTLAAILTDTGLTEIEIETKDGRIRVVRAPAPIYNAPASVPAIQVAAAAAPAPTAAATAPVEQDFSHHPGAVLSPMVGVAYLAPEPGAAPFIVLGQPVAAGQTVLLIEAMKTFNQVKAPKAGTVTHILIASGAPVEYGEPLLVIE
jgi:acetyl-CoA carboxylase biotin carboxyl carrier protein